METKRAQSKDEWLVGLYGNARAYVKMRRGHRRPWPKTVHIHFKPGDVSSVGTQLGLRGGGEVRSTAEAG